MLGEKNTWKKIEYGHIEAQLTFMKGKILTIIDALGLNEQQNKATKDLIHSAIGNTKNIFWRHTIGQDMFPESESENGDKKAKSK